MSTDSPRENQQIVATHVEQLSNLMVTERRPDRVPASGFIMMLQDSQRQMEALLSVLHKAQHEAHDAREASVREALYYNRGIFSGLYHLALQVIQDDQEPYPLSIGYEDRTLHTQNMDEQLSAEDLEKIRQRFARVLAQGAIEENCNLAQQLSPDDPSIDAYYPIIEGLVTFRWNIIELIILVRDSLESAPGVGEGTRFISLMNTTTIIRRMDDNDLTSVMNNNLERHYMAYLMSSYRLAEHQARLRSIDLLRSAQDAAEPPPDDFHLSTLFTPRDISVEEKEQALVISLLHVLEERIFPICSTEDVQNISARTLFARFEFDRDYMLYVAYAMHPDTRVMVDEDGTDLTVDAFLDKAIAFVGKDVAEEKKRIYRALGTKQQQPEATEEPLESASPEEPAELPPHGEDQPETRPPTWLEKLITKHPKLLGWLARFRRRD